MYISGFFAHFIFPTYYQVTILIPDWGFSSISFQLILFLWLTTSLTQSTAFHFPPFIVCWLLQLWLHQIKGWPINHAASLLASGGWIRYLYIYMCIFIYIPSISLIPQNVWLHLAPFHLLLLLLVNVNYLLDFEWHDGCLFLLLLFLMFFACFPLLWPNATRSKAETEAAFNWFCSWQQWVGSSRAQM